MTEKNTPWSRCFIKLKASRPNRLCHELARPKGGVWGNRKANAAHNIRVTTIDKPMQVEGESFAIKQMRIARIGGYDMGALDGAFTPLETREFPAGSFYVDMAQPMANAAFYYLEPQARDGFVGWRVLDEKLRGATVYPIFKMRREIR